MHNSWCFEEHFSVILKGPVDQQEHQNGLHNQVTMT